MQQLLVQNDMAAPTLDPCNYVVCLVALARLCKMTVLLCELFRCVYERKTLVLSLKPISCFWNPLLFLELYNYFLNHVLLSFISKTCCILFAIKIKYKSRLYYESSNISFSIALCGLGFVSWLKFQVLLRHVSILRVAWI
jgi:hypothetical protein